MWIFNSCVVQGSTVIWLWIFSLSLLILRFIHAVGFISSSFYCWVTSCSVAKSFLTLPDTMDCSMPGFPTPQHLLEFAHSKFTSIELVMPSNHLILCCTLLLLPSVFPRVRVFSNELGVCIRWPKYWSFSFSISHSKNIQGWFPLRLTGLISLQFKGFSTVFSSTTVGRHQFFGTLSL